MSKSDTEILAQAFITPRTDYCDAIVMIVIVVIMLFSGPPKTETKGLQMVPNAAARVFTRSKKLDHITPVMMS